MNNAQKLLEYKSKYEGKTFSTKFGDIKIVDYMSSKKVVVRFTNTGYITTTKLALVLSGQIKDKLKPSVVGVGIVGDESVKKNGKLTPEYSIWKSMLVRCYDNAYKDKFLTYQDCSVTDSFKHLKFFKDWCEKQKGFMCTDSKGIPFTLDKDILVKGNNLYAPERCCFVPEEINILFTKSNKTRGQYPIGVCLNKQCTGFVARLCCGQSKRKHLGTYKSEEEAFYAYKAAKEAYIKEVANKWKDTIDHKVYEALMKYQVEITD